MGLFQKFGLALVLPLILGNIAASADDMPAYIAGKSFKTVGIQIDDQHWEGDFEFSTVIDPDHPSTLNIPSLGCTSNLFAVESDEKSVIFKQRLTAGKDKCLDLGYIEVIYDASSRLIKFSHSPLRAAKPIYTRGLLWEVNQFVPTYDEMKAAAEKYSPVKDRPQVLGSWEVKGSGWTWSHLDCYRKMPMDAGLNIQPDSRGRISIWAVPTDAGGEIYAVYATDPEGKQLTYKRLHHFAGDIFASRDGFMDQEGLVLLSPSRDDDLGRTQMFVIKKGAPNYDGTTYMMCSPESAAAATPTYATEQPED